VTKKGLLTVRLNNLLSPALGIPAVVFVAVVLSTSQLSERAAFFGFAVIGALY
jgi:hypothetical protein